jgi:ankyrin repeat protein
LVKNILEEYPEFLEIKSSIGWTPALFASRYGHKEVLEYLHKKGAQLEFERGYNCSHVACYGADPETLKYLFEVAQVNPNPQS